VGTITDLGEWGEQGLHVKKIKPCSITMNSEPYRKARTSQNATGSQFHEQKWQICQNFVVDCLKWVIVNTVVHCICKHFLSRLHLLLCRSSILARFAITTPPLPATATLIKIWRACTATIHLIRKNSLL
jgi:hypothetical protein